MAGLPEDITQADLVTPVFELHGTPYAGQVQRPAHLYRHELIAP